MAGRSNRVGRSKTGRRQGGRNERPTVLVVCEGETEYGYFMYVRNKFRASWIRPRISDVSDPKGIVACAERERKSLSKKGLDVETWVVFDAESEAEALNRQYRPCIEAALKKGMKVANSSPCFEYWPLIHFAPGINVFEPGQAESELRKPGRVEGYRKPELPMDRLWELFISGEPSAAARRRREDHAKLGEEPRFARPVTYVDELADRLLDISSY